jgi:hypothetical protein
VKKRRINDLPSSCGNNRRETFEALLCLRALCEIGGRTISPPSSYVLSYGRTIPPQVSRADARNPVRIAINSIVDREYTVGLTEMWSPSVDLSYMHFILPSFRYEFHVRATWASILRIPCIVKRGT